jgi:peptidoglycan/xylan/chitin deacetylase (PgdA/CDA1 family)
MQNAKRVSKLCISVVFYVWDSFRRQLGPFFGKEPECLCTVLVYHAISSREVSRFAKQMDLLKRLTFPVSAAQLGGLTKGIHHAAVTFDDGFQSLCENALPVLLERQIPSTVFIPAGCVGCRPTWPDDPWDPNSDEPVMTELQIKGLPAEWVTVGCHSMTHADLTALGGDEIRKELVESKEKLESITGRCVDLFSVPYGEFDDRVLKSAASAGYQMVFNSSPGPMDRGKSTYVVGRIRVSPSDWNLEFKLKTLGGYRWLPWAIRLKRQIQSLFLKSDE